MKNFIVICFLFGCMMLSCTSFHQPYDAARLTSSDIAGLYEEAKSSEISQLNEAYCLLSSATRTDGVTISGQEFMSYVLSLSKEQVDSLSAICCTVEMTEAREDCTFMLLRNFLI